MERKEPTISGSIKPEKDEVSARQPQPRDPKQRPSAGPRPPEGKRPPPPPAGPGHSGGGGNGLAIVALIVAVAGLGGSGFLAWQWKVAQDELIQADSRIESLERRLDITSDESSEYVENIQEKLEWADTEIRKLWGVAYDTNRGRISTNQQNIESLTNDLNAVKGTADSANSRVSELSTALEETQGELTGLNESLDALQASAESLEEQRRRLQNLSEDVDRLDRSLANLAGVADRVSANEEAIEAIDSFRVTINRELTSIKEQL